MTSIPYQASVALMIKGQLDLDSSSSALGALLVDSTHNGTEDSDNTLVSDISDHEVTNSGYSRQILTGVTITTDNTNNRVVLDADDPDFGSISATPALTVDGCYVYYDDGAASDGERELVAFVDIPNKAADGNAFVVVFNSGGILRFNMVTS